MSITRLNYLLMRDIVPFNFGMDYNHWVTFYENNPNMRELLCPSNPATWSEEVKQKVDSRAKEENELVARLMTLSDDEFYKEVDKLSKKELI